MRLLKSISFIDNLQVSVINSKLHNISCAWFLLIVFFSSNFIYGVLIYGSIKLLLINF